MDNNLVKIIQSQQETIRDLLKIIELLSKDRAVTTPIIPIPPYQPVNPWKYPEPYTPYVGDPPPYADGTGNITISLG